MRFSASTFRFIWSIITILRLTTPTMHFFNELNQSGHFAWACIVPPTLTESSWVDNEWYVDTINVLFVLFRSHWTNLFLLHSGCRDVGMIAVAEIMRSITAPPARPTPPRPHDPCPLSPLSSSTSCLYRHNSKHSLNFEREIQPWQIKK